MLACKLFLIASTILAVVLLFMSWFLEDIMHVRAELLEELDDLMYNLLRQILFDKSPELAHKKGLSFELLHQASYNLVKKEKRRNKEQFWQRPRPSQKTLYAGSTE